MRTGFFSIVFENTCSYCQSSCSSKCAYTASIQLLSVAYQEDCLL